ncbi:hypothetical protein SeLEV6574_g07830 [Synchytrium endobioticum]|nr:hypothetical protein SeLEV6574_g07830 [Synchytrium endobioticum]
MFGLNWSQKTGDKKEDLAMSTEIRKMNEELFMATLETYKKTWLTIDTSMITYSQRMFTALRKAEDETEKNAATTATDNNDDSSSSDATYTDHGKNRKLKRKALQRGKKDDKGDDQEINSKKRVKNISPNASSSKSPPYHPPHLQPHMYPPSGKRGDGTFEGIDVLRVDKKEC